MVLFAQLIIYWLLVDKQQNRDRLDNLHRMSRFYNLRMEEKGTQLDKVTSRRSRKDEQGRDFMCGCGKRYLSYPALYTHIKTKHEGRQPEGTLKSGPIKRHKPKFEEDTLRSLYALLHKQDLRLLSELGDAVAGRVALTSRLKNELVPKELFENYLWLMRQGEVKLQASSSLDLALAVFLLNVGEHVNDKIYQQFLLFCRIARGCWVEHGEQVHKAYFSKAGTGPFQLSAFTGGEVRYFPIICDFVVQCYIPVTYGEKEVNVSLMELMLFDFCNWLYLHKLTPIRTSFGKDFKLDYKPPPIKTRHSKQDSRDVNSHNKDEEEQSEQEGSELEELMEEEGEQDNKRDNSKQSI